MAGGRSGNARLTLKGVVINGTLLLFLLLTFVAEPYSYLLR